MKQLGQDFFGIWQRPREMTTLLQLNPTTFYRRLPYQLLKMGREYEITLTPAADVTPVILSTNTRRLSRAMKELAIENDMVVTVNRTAKREVKFAGLDAKPVDKPVEPVTKPAGKPPIPAAAK